MRNRYEKLLPGDGMNKRGKYLVVAEKENLLEGVLVKSCYVLWSESGFKAAPIKNHQIIGASIPGRACEEISVNTDIL